MNVENIKRAFQGKRKHNNNNNDNHNNNDNIHNQVK